MNKSSWALRMERGIVERSRARFDLVVALERRNRDERYAQASEHEIKKMNKEITYA